MLCQRQWKTLTDNTRSKWHLSYVTVLVYRVPVTTWQTALAIFSVSPFLFWVCILFPKDYSAKPDENERETRLTLNKPPALCISAAPVIMSHHAVPGWLSHLRSVPWLCHDLFISCFIQWQKWFSSSLYSSKKRSENKLKKNTW